MTGRVGRPGRPRAGGGVSANPRDEIIAVGTRLFAEVGFARTTMTRIAHESGLRQASLYYWFSSKEELLRATAAVNRSSVVASEALAHLEAPAEVKLFRLLHDDTLFVCGGPCDYSEIERLAAQRPDDFVGFWADYRQLFTAVRGWLAAGVATGALAVAGDLDHAAASALTINEGQQKLYRLARDGGAEHYLRLPALEPDQHADQAASTTLASVLSDRTRLADVRRAALALQLDDPDHDPDDPHPDPSPEMSPIQGRSAQKNSR